MSDWQSVKVSSFLPPEIPQSLSTITGLIDQFLDLYKQAIATAKLYQKTLGGGGPDVLGTLVNAIVDTVEGLLQAGKIHVLHMPLPKAIPLQRVTLPPTLEAAALGLGFEVTAVGTLTEASSTAYSDLVGGTRGNSGFFNTFVQTLSDVRDINRPQYFSPNDYVAMTVLMFGSNTFSDALKFAQAFNRIFKPTNNNDLTARTIPVPQNVRIKVIAVPSSTNIGVRLDWDRPPKVFQPLFFPGVSIRPVKYAIIRCTDPKLAQSASSVLDFFSTQVLVKGLTSDDDAKSAVVIAVGAATTYAYIDTSELDATVSYSYCVAWQVEITENNATTTQPYDRVSNVVRTRVRAPAPPTIGYPPDWEARGSVISLIPDLAVQVRTLLERIRVLADRKTGGPTEALTNTLEMLEQNVSRFAAQISQLNAQAKRLSAMFDTALPSLHATAIEGIGGNAFLMGELGKRLNDKTDPNRPPFDSNEYVMGVCIVAGGPRKADIQPIIDFLNSLFGTETADNPLLNVLTSLDAVVDAQETSVFGPDMKPLPVAPDGTVTDPATGSTVPASSIDPLTGLPVVTPLPVIADSGTPVATLDPANPNAGDTNVKSPTEAC